MTEKLYDLNPMAAEFTARVRACRPSGDRWEVLLDRTAFYPEGGGQPADRGTLSAGGERVSVLDVREREGEVVHLCGGALPAGSEVRGEVDFPRRFDHMQQHSGEHIVSGIICRRYGCENVGFHMGREAVTVDFSRPVPPEDLPAIEAEANAYLWQDRAVEIRTLQGEALAAAVYRSKKALPGAVRLVSFPGADCCACCGTHVLRAGQVGLILLLTCQRFKEGSRLELLCGGRAYAYAAAVQEQNRKISRLLSAKPLDTYPAAERCRQELHALRGRAAALEGELFARRAADWAGAGDVVLFEADMPADALRRLFDAVHAVCGGGCAVFAGADGGYKYAIGGIGGDARPVARALNAALHGRGGGKPSFVQGSVEGTREEIEAVLRPFLQGAGENAGAENGE